MTNDDLIILGYILLFIILIWLIFVVLKVIGKWKIFTKAGEEGWPALIPIYNEVVMCRIVGVNPYWVLIKWLSPLVAFLPVVGSLAQMFIAIYYTILLYVSLSRSFGKSDSWVVGFIFLEPFFLLALGFGKSEYLGKKPMDDFVFKNKDETSQSDLKTLCPKCNSIINENDKFCTNCGEEIIEEKEVVEKTEKKDIYCSNCNTLLDENSNFCTNCGKKRES